MCTWPNAASPQIHPGQPSDAHPEQPVVARGGQRCPPVVASCVRRHRDGHGHSSVAMRRHAWRQASRVTPWSPTRSPGLRYMATRRRSAFSCSLPSLSLEPTRYLRRRAMSGRQACRTSHESSVCVSHAIRTQARATPCGAVRAAAATAHGPNGGCCSSSGGARCTTSVPGPGAPSLFQLRLSALSRSLTARRWLKAAPPFGSRRLLQTTYRSELAGRDAAGLYLPRPRPTTTRSE